MSSIVYNMDCMVGMKDYPDKYFDLAIVDPPYGSGIGIEGGVLKSQERIGTERTSTTSVHKLGNAGKWSQQNRGEVGKEIWKKILSWDVPPKQEYFEQLFRISRNLVI